MKGVLNKRKTHFTTEPCRVDKESKLREKKLMRLKLSDMKDERKICYKKMGYSWSTKRRRPSVLEDIRVSTEALHHDRP